MSNKDKIFAVSMCAAMLLGQAAFAENVNNTASGFVFYDTDKDGVYDADKGDYPLSNHTIRTAYKEIIEKPTSVSKSDFESFNEIHTDKNGKYAAAYPVSDVNKYCLVYVEADTMNYICTTGNSAQAYMKKGGLERTFDNIGLVSNGEQSGEHKIFVKAETVCNLKIAETAEDGSEVSFTIKPSAGHKFKDGAVSYSITTQSDRSIELKSYEGKSEPGTNELTEITGTFIMPNEPIYVFFRVNETELKLRATETEFKAASDKLKFTANFTNMTDSAITDAVGAAVICDNSTGRMLDVKTVENFVPGDNFTEIELPASAGTYIVKTFIWDKEQNIYPYAVTKNYGSVHNVSLGENGQK
ncbi:MAG: hypothetical protein Q4G33_06540 [bacterium]|nr:hypothetical protein [bacterium]